MDCEICDKCIKQIIDILVDSTPSSNYGQDMSMEDIARDEIEDFIHEFINNLNIMMRNNKSKILK